MNECPRCHVLHQRRNQYGGWECIICRVALPESLPRGVAPPSWWRRLWSWAVGAV